MAQLPNEAVSFLTPYSGLLLTICLVVLSGIKNGILEPYIFPRYYGNVLSRLSDRDQRGFLVHHISAAVKVIILAIGMKPFGDVIFGKSTLHDPFIKGHTQPTMGDMLIPLGQLFVGLYIFELLARKKVSLITWLHHVSAVVLGQTAVALTLDPENQSNATMEFILCFIWAAFDALSELWLNLAFIIYRIYPDNHNVLVYAFGSTFVLNVSGTIAETIIIMTLFGQSWDRWELSFKIVTPILHTLFTIAQLHCARVLFALWMKEKRRLYEVERSVSDIESGSDDDSQTKVTVIQVLAGTKKEMQGMENQSTPYTSTFHLNGNSDVGAGMNKSLSSR
jgi:hypothetical protein